MDRMFRMNNLKKGYMLHSKQGMYKVVYDSEKKLLVALNIKSNEIVSIKKIYSCIEKISYQRKNVACIKSSELVFIV